MSIPSFEEAFQQVLPHGAIVEPTQKLAPEMVAFWMKDEKGNFKRVARKPGEMTEDVDATWFPISETVCTQIVQTRNALSYIGLGPNQEQPQLYGPNKEPLKIAKRDTGFFVMTAPGVKVGEVIEERSFEAVVDILSERAAIVKNAILLRQHNIQLKYAYDSLPAALLPPSQATAFYETALKTLITETAVKHSHHMTEHERKLCDELEKFLHTCAWGTHEQNGDMIAPMLYNGEPAGGAMFVLPREDLADPSQVVNRLDDGRPFMVVMNDDMTREWAGLTVAKHVMIMKSYKNLQGATEDKGAFLRIESEAMQTQIGLANALSRGMLRKTVKGIVRGLHSQHGHNPEAYVKAVEALFTAEHDRIAASLDQCIDAGVPRSKQEMRLRAGLYKTLMAFVIADDASEGDAKVARKLQHDMVEFLYNGVGLMLPEQRKPDHLQN